MKKMIPIGIVGLLLFMLIIYSASAAIYIKFPDVEGESQDPDHDKWIDVLSIDWGVRDGPEELRVGNMKFSKKTDKATAQLFQATCSEGDKNDFYSEVTLDICETDAAGAQFCYMKYTMFDAVITSYSTSGETADRPKEHISLNFDKIDMEYTPIRGEGNEATCS